MDNLIDHDPKKGYVNLILNCGGKSFLQKVTSIIRWIRKNKILKKALFYDININCQTIMQSAVAGGS